MTSSHHPSTIAWRAGLCRVLLPLLLCACAGPDPAHTAPAAQHGQEEVHKAAATLLDGIRLYEKGNFKSAIATLDTPGMLAAPNAIRLEALKYAAFSHCVLEEYAACRRAFDLSLALDADFTLRSSERGHPMWGPVFDEAKSAQERRRADTSLDLERERWRGIDLWRAR